MAAHHNTILLLLHLLGPFFALLNILDLSFSLLCHTLLAYRCAIT